MLKPTLKKDLPYDKAGSPIRQIRISTSIATIQTEEGSSYDIPASEIDKWIEEVPEESEFEKVAKEIDKAIYDFQSCTGLKPIDLYLGRREYAEITRGILHCEKWKWLNVFIVGNETHIGITGYHQENSKQPEKKEPREWYISIDNRNPVILNIPLVASKENVHKLYKGLNFIKVREITEEDNSQSFMRKIPKS